MSDVSTVLPQGAGYGVVVGEHAPFNDRPPSYHPPGIGLFFSGLMILLTYIQGRYTAFSPCKLEVYWLFPILISMSSQCGRIHIGFPKRQAGTHRRRHRFRLDMGSDATAK